MAGKTAQSQSPRDAGEGRAQRCVPSAREFWRRRRVREECRRAPLAGGGRGKFSGAGTAVPATAIGIQPCNRELCPTGRGEQSSPCHHCPAPGQIRRQKSASPTPIHQGCWAGKKTTRWICGRSPQPAAERIEHRQRPVARTLTERQTSHMNGPSRIRIRPAGFQPRRRERRTDPASVARASPRDRHAVTPTVWCAVAC
jgi:hypothetical protein